MKQKLNIVFILLFWANIIQAQQLPLSNIRQKKIATTGTIILDSLTFVPSSIQIKNIDSSFYTINFSHRTITWKKKVSEDSVHITYRVFPFQLDATARLYNYDSVKNNFLSSAALTKPNNTATNSNGLLDFGNMDYRGSFGRSLSFGNSQDAVFNSQLNLQLNGIIGDSIQLAVAITDNNIPIQPDGTTQQLNEFDKILLQFKKKNWEVNLGDIDLRQNQNYFLSFYKRLQGLSYSQQTKIGSNTSNKLLLSGAIAKGKFAKNVFNGQEGNQGPYRLATPNNDLFFIILAGTERIFIDGELLQRGEDQDYYINYNTAEISFTPKRMITKDKRIQIEFEYADRNYLNSLIYVNNEIVFGKKLKLDIALYSNTDAKNSSINQQLDSKQKQFLSNVGDSVQQAFYPIASIDSFSTTKILYAKRVNPSNPSLDSIFVYSTNKDSARYTLNFISEGNNKGNYIPYYNSANGKVFQWVAPVAGIPQGQYEPATFLITPKQQQIVTISTEYNINSRTILKSDIAVSNYDINTFSSRDKADNTGYAAKFSLLHTGKLKRDISYTSLVGYEYVNERFKPLERLRNVEFSRDWGLNVVPVATTEHLPKFSIELKDKSNNLLQYAADGYFRSDLYQGIKNALLYTQHFNDFLFKTNCSIVNNHSPVDKGFFLRPTLDLSKEFKQLKHYTIGIGYTSEHNEQRNILSDSLLPVSFAFETISAYIKSNLQRKNSWSFNYATRSDQLPFQKSLLQVDRSHNYTFTTELLQNPRHQFKFNITYRQLNVNAGAIAGLASDNSLLGRTEYNINEWNGFITGNVLYELGAGQEQRRDFSYVEVPAGKGQYAWNDYNNDGIPQLNEFEIALFPDQAKYVRIYTPTNQFIKANYTQFNYSISINPRLLHSKDASFKNKDFLSKLLFQSSMQTFKKVVSNGSPNWNPFNGNIEDSALISLNNIMSNTIAFNRFSSSWGIDISNFRSFNKSLLTYGFESRQLNEWTIKPRVNLHQKFTLELIQKFGTNSLATPQFANRNYELTTLSAEPKLSYTYQSKFRMQLSYIYTQKNNAILYGGEKSVSNGLSIEGKYNSVSNTSLLVKLSSGNINFTGNSGTTISYIMLDGLQAGKNTLWNVELTKRLGPSLELNLNYEGRKSGEARTIHIGRMGIRAIL